MHCFVRRYEFSNKLIFEKYCKLNCILPLISWDCSINYWIGRAKTKIFLQHYFLFSNQSLSFKASDQICYCGSFSKINWFWLLCFRYVTVFVFILHKQNVVPSVILVPVNSFYPSNRQLESFPHHLCLFYRKYHSCASWNKCTLRWENATYAPKTCQKFINQRPTHLITSHYCLFGWFVRLCSFNGI